ncbi:Imidazolonepropionase [Marinactinospora thermotolerans DSM 45154]|uniref:Imidazolonepropionase n=1 Tax=Marinactinospora thermotolerans DSM 45154 TaxID=1122192 RepID=A0A1T4KGB2_9ACTN|nr:amidohydrolase family protein [Marinactinospora thermotolerans]SJZ41454.1 Imidazolonepropionase [Marinactinospora thermotolerans DSM 45154]
MRRPSSPAPSPDSTSPTAGELDSPASLDRRELLTTSGKAALAGGTAWALASSGPAVTARPAEAAEGPQLTVTEGTNISATASPDGAWIAFDLYTSIWLAPATGGTARRLTGDLHDATRPHFSPDSRSLVFQAYREGNYHLYLLDLPDGRPRRLTSGPHDHREPRFSPDGRTVALVSDRGDGYAVWLHDLASGRLTRLTSDGSDAASPSWTPDGGGIVHTVDGARIQVTHLDATTRELVAAQEDTAVFSPVLAEDGTTLAYVRAHGDTAQLVVGGQAVSGTEDVFPGALSWLGAGRLLYTADGHVRIRETRTGRVSDVAVRARVPYRRPASRGPRRSPDDTARHAVRGIAGPVLSPDGARVAFGALGALWVMPIGERPRAFVDDGSFAADPDWHPDGKSLVYSSDRAGAPALWRHHLDTGTDERLTHLDGAQITPRWSPDGRHIAYQDHNGATWVLRLEDGSARQVLPALFQPGRPTWSPDGGVLALAAVRPRSRRFREGTSQILTVDLRSGATRYIEPAPHRSLSTRGDDGPVWSPDGSRMAFVMESVLWTVAVNGDGSFDGEPRQVTTEAADAPSWSGDSARLLYLNNGRLRQVPAAGGRPTTVDLPLTWRRRRPKGRTILQVGALWDGTATRLRRDVDIVIEDDRITAVEARGDHTGEGDTRVIDATHLTAMPGLVDAHVHWHLRGRQWGSRQGPLWLAYGVTTVRSPGDPAYRMLETREALDAGKVLGPRLLGTGEAIDGTRVYYNFMRPTHDEEQLELELGRAIALDYDLVKTYVRLPVSLQRNAIARAHADDLPLTSHYLYPAVHLGMDGMEHTGATNRLGYSHTVSRLGRSYADATRLFAKSRMPITPTLFTSQALYAEDASLADDERTRVLYPDWEYHALRDKVEAAREDTPAARLNREALKGQVAMLLEIHRGGGIILGGTDAPLDNVAISLHQNMRALVHHGFTPREALMVTTGTAARWLGLGDHLGAVKKGRLADIALVEGDPLSDITAAAAVRMVVANGEVHTVEELLAPFREAAQPLHEGTAATSVGDPLPLVDDDRHWWHGESEPASPHRC